MEKMRRKTPIYTNHTVGISIKQASLSVFWETALLIMHSG